MPAKITFVRHTTMAKKEVPAKKGSKSSSDADPVSEVPAKEGGESSSDSDPVSEDVQGQAGAFGKKAQSPKGPSRSNRPGSPSYRDSLMAGATPKGQRPSQNYLDASPVLRGHTQSPEGSYRRAPTPLVPPTPRNMETSHILCPPSEDTPDQLPSAQPSKRPKAATAKPTTIVSRPLTRNFSKGSLPVTKADSHPTPGSKKITSAPSTRKASSSKTVPHGTPVVSTSAQVTPQTPGQSIRPNPKSSHASGWIIGGKPPAKDPCVSTKGPRVNTRPKPIRADPKKSADYQPGEPPAKPKGPPKLPLNAPVSSTPPTQLPPPPAQPQSPPAALQSQILAQSSLAPALSSSASVHSSPNQHPVEEGTLVTRDGHVATNQVVRKTWMDNLLGDCFEDSQGEEGAAIPAGPSVHNGKGKALEKANTPPLEDEQKKEVEMEALLALKKKYEEATALMEGVLLEAEAVLGKGNVVRRHQKTWGTAGSVIKKTLDQWDYSIKKSQQEKTPMVQIGDLIFPDSPTASRPQPSRSQSAKRPAPSAKAPPAPKKARTKKAKKEKSPSPDPGAGLPDQLAEKKRKEAQAKLDKWEARLHGPLSALDRLKYKQTMEILDPKQPGKNVGQAGNELGYLIAGFCRNILTSFNLEDFLRKGELKDHTSYHPQIFPASVLATPSAPRLLQLGFPDPFWNNQHVNCDVLQEAHQYAKKVATVISPSWLSVLFASCRTGSTEAYTDTEQVENLVGLGYTWVNQCVCDAILIVSDSIVPVVTGVHEHAVPELEGIRNAGEFINQKLNSFPSTAGRKGTREATNFGIHYILRRAYEALLGLALMYEASIVKEMEDALDEDPAITGAELKLKKKALGQTALFRSGPSLPRSKTVSATSEHKDKEKMVGTKWTNRKQCAYASLAVFLVYGVAGWFVLLTNYRKYSMADIYGLMTLANLSALERLRKKADAQKMAADDSIENMPQIDTSSPHTSGAWQHTNCLIMYAILTPDFTRSKKFHDWNKTSDSWAKGLVAHDLAEAILADVYRELMDPGASLMPNLQAAPEVCLSSANRLAMDVFITLTRSSINDGELEEKIRQSEANIQKIREDAAIDSLLGGGDAMDVLAQYMDFEAEEKNVPHPNSKKGKARAKEDAIEAAWEQGPNEYESDGIDDSDPEDGSGDDDDADMEHVA
ncbi:hypothetical protein PCASD_05563 [Puccinia coronata f. sp. avenae]|uniref:Uncharacterized protein n=1 Tax=Puccinia coronata f. sp. avenae TaxID=200324 RepID=A0A2N5UVP3_9BASI|nr:hypothetical protein PCASD_05563 [Puccinia coronata f. sp. avenae]